MVPREVFKAISGLESEERDLLERRYGEPPPPPHLSKGDFQFSPLTAMLEERFGLKFYSRGKNSKGADENGATPRYISTSGFPNGGYLAIHVLA